MTRRAIASGDERIGVERRLERWMQVVPYGLLVVSLVIGWATGDLRAGEMPMAIGVSAAAAAWIFALITAWPSTRRGTAWSLVYVGGLLAFIAALMLVSLWFGFFAWVAYAHAWEYLRGWWRLAGVLAGAIVYVAALAGGVPALQMPGILGYLAAVAGIVLVVMVFGAWSEAVTARSEERRVIIAQLAEANRRLEAAIAENEALQAELLSQARTAGALEERQRMAGEIHDTLAQGLVGVITQLEAAARAAETDPDALRRHLDHATGLARESLAEARRSVRAIGPGQLDDARLPDAIRGVADRWSAIHDLPVELTVTGDPLPLHPDVEVAILRAAQEALANVARHAGAGRVAVTLSFMEDLVSLDVRDDGTGFDPGTASDDGHPAGGYGLTAMRRRLQTVGGRLEVESSPGAGTALSASVPLTMTGEDDGG